MLSMGAVEYMQVDLDVRKKKAYHNHYFLAFYKRWKGIGEYYSAKWLYFMESVCLFIVVRWYQESSLKF
jgi:hypothetical protein